MAVTWKKLVFEDDLATWHDARNVNTHADITSAGADIEDAVTKRHAQNTDTGTTNTTFQIDSDATGPKLKNSSGALHVRNSGDTDFQKVYCSDIIAESNQSFEEVYPVVFACPGKNTRIDGSYDTDATATFDKARKFVTGWTAYISLRGDNNGFIHRHTRYYLYVRARKDAGATHFEVGVYNSTDGVYPLSMRDIASEVTTTYKTILVGDFVADWDDNDNVYIPFGSGSGTGNKYIDYVMIVPAEISGGTAVNDSGDVSIKGAISGLEKSADPPEPDEGEYVIWMSDGTGYGDDGDVCIASKAGGVTKKAILFDHSAGTAW